MLYVLGGVGPLFLVLAAWNPIAGFHIPTMLGLVAPCLLVELNLFNFHW